MIDGFVRVCAATPRVRVADPAHNAQAILDLARQADAQGAHLTVFPELCTTGYTCGDLFLQDTLLNGAMDALNTILEGSKALAGVLAVGLPFAHGGKLYNCMALMQGGRLFGLVPKQNIPSYSEFYEGRHFCAASGYFSLEPSGAAELIEHPLLLRCRQLPQLVIGAEICEDLWAANAPSGQLAQMGATIIVNGSASSEVVGKAAFRRVLLQAQSAKAICGYVYADAGFGESSQDLVFAGHNLIYENGTKLAESQRFSTGLTMADVDVQRLAHERRRITSFQAIEPAYMEEFSLEIGELSLLRRVEKSPFVPEDVAQRHARCEEILTMQATGLATRLAAISGKSVVLGLSGGLDSTLALIVAVRAFDMLQLDRAGIHCVTMPCFGTTGRTRTNAELLALEYGTDFREINIEKSVLSHFADIGQSTENHDATFENAQARERTQVLMDLANMTGGFVVGTGDLSELALGWATYNGDHMSMYGVNASIPKTLVKHLVEHEASLRQGGLQRCLLDILATPISPELLPPKDGDIAQKTEEIVGPYALHDFFLYYLLRFGMEPRKILRLAVHAFADEYDRQTIKAWLKVFLRRFFTQQFKRSCMPDGAKVGSVALSPRGDFRMPSDAAFSLWLSQLESL